MSAENDTTAQPQDFSARHTGYYLLGKGYRAYNPVLMRFASADSWSPFGRGGLNAYAYCGGDPVNASDPSGHFLWFGHIKSQLSALGARVLNPFSRPRQQQGDWYYDTVSMASSGRTSVSTLSSHSSMESLGPPAATARPSPVSSRPTSTSSPPTVLDQIFKHLPVDDLTRMRSVSSSMRDAVDRFSGRNFEAYLGSRPGHPGIKARGNASYVESVIGAAAGKVPNVSRAQAAREMTLADARMHFKAMHDYTWDVNVGLEGRQEHFKGTWKAPTHTLVKAVRNP